MKDKDTSIAAKLFAGITVVYALSPIDLVPDFIPVLGYLDDVILLPMLVALTIKFIPKKVMELVKEKLRKHPFAVRLIKTKEKRGTLQ